jgi:hypothetical protein
MQRAFLNLGCRIPVLGVVGIHARYQLKLYDSDEPFAEQFSSLLAIGIGADAVISFGVRP